VRQDCQTIRCELRTLQERVASSISQSSRSWIGSALVILVVVVFLIAISQPKTPAYQELVDSVFHNWIAMAVCAAALWIARRERLGPMPTILRFASGVLLPIFMILSILGLLIWPQLWTMLKPFGIIEKEVGSPAITATLALGLISCAFLMFRLFFRWVCKFSRRYEHSGFAVGFGPLYLFFRRRRTF